MTGGLAQLGEHLLCKQGVVGSIPSSSTITSDILIADPSGAPRGFGQRFARIGCRSLTIRRVENQRRRRRAVRPLGLRYRAVDDNLIASIDVQGPARAAKNGERVNSNSP